MKVGKLGWLVAMFLSGGMAVAQGTVDDYRRAYALKEKFSADKVFYSNVNPQWIEGTHQFWYVRNTPDGRLYVSVDADKKARKELFDSHRLAKALGAASGKEVKPEALALGHLSVSKGLDTLRFVFNNQRWMYASRKNQLVNEGAGQTAVGEAVILPETVKKGGGLKLVKAGHPGGHLPVQGGGGGEAVGIDSVVELHMTWGDGAGVVRLPHPQGAAAEIAVRLPIEPRTQGRVRDEPAECGDHLIVLLVDGSCGHGSFHSGHLFRVSGAGPGPQRADRFHYKRPGPGGQG